jgi:uncharacterized membrane protein HdeD (DUF308 family)
MPNRLRAFDAPGLFPLVEMDAVRPMRSWFVGLGVAFAVLGVLAIFLPFAATLVTTVVIGWLMLVGGAIQLVHALQNRRWAGSGWAIVEGVIMVIAGVLVAVFPVAGKLTLTLVLAAFFVVEGVLKIVRCVQHRAMRAWGWLLFDGIASLVLGGLIWAGWPSTAVWALGLLVGIDLLMGGVSLLLIGLGAGAVAARV